MEHGAADAVRGMSVDAIIAEEFSYQRRYAWEEVQKPTLMAKQAKTLKIFTPNGLNHAYQEFMRDATDHKSLKFTSYDGYLPSDEIDRLAETLPEVIRMQEIYADFIEVFGGVFRGVDEVIAGDLEDPAPGVQYAGGVDLAKHADWTVDIKLRRDTRHLAYFDRFRELDWGFQKRTIEASADRYNDTVMLIDSTGLGDPIYDDLVSAGCRVKGYKFTNESKRKLIENLAVQIQNKSFTMPEIPELISELKMFQAEQLPSGNIRYAAPEGYHDDCVIALALAVWEACDTTEGGASTGKYKRGRRELPF
jgi:hypothetical protein